MVENSEQQQSDNIQQTDNICYTFTDPFVLWKSSSEDSVLISWMTWMWKPSDKPFHKGRAQQRKHMDDWLLILSIFRIAPGEGLEPDAHRGGREVLQIWGSKAVQCFVHDIQYLELN